MKKLLFIATVLMLIVFNSCSKICDDECTGDITIYNVSPDWIQEVIINITWADSTTINVMMDSENTYYHRPAGLTIIKMTYKSDSCVYYSSSFVNIEKCKHIPVFCDFDRD